MDLFGNELDKTKNILPKGGIVNYYGKLFTEQEAQNYFRCLMNSITWKNDELVLFGKHIVTKRKIAWYGDNEYSYTYSNTTKQAKIWTEELLQLKNKVEEETNEKFNSCLLNLYHDGNEGMGWHSDNEADINRNVAIASLSFGAERKFVFKHKRTKEKISVHLENGGLLLMKPPTQTNWLHSLPPTKKIKNPRINLTFRSILNQG